MTAYVANNNDTAVETWVQDLGSGAGNCSCFECKGTGSPLFPFAMHGSGQWPECKGTGWVLISV